MNAYETVTTDAYTRASSIQHAALFNHSTQGSLLARRSFKLNDCVCGKQHKIENSISASSLYRYHSSNRRSDERDPSHLSTTYIIRCLLTTFRRVYCIKQNLFSYLGDILIETLFFPAAQGMTQILDGAQNHLRPGHVREREEKYRSNKIEPQ